MYHRGVPLAPKNSAIMHSLRVFVRLPCSSAFPIPLSPLPKEVEKKNPQNPMLDLANSQKIFSSSSTTRLLHAMTVLEAVAIQPLVHLGSLIMTSPLIKSPVLGNLILSFVKKTFYKHFCAGERYEEILQTVEKLNQDGLRSMLFYGVEDADDDLVCDHNMESFLGTIKYSKSLPPSSTSFIAVKITAICPTRLLKRVSDLLRWEQRQRNSSFHLPWKMKTLPVFSDSTPLYHTLIRPDPLSTNEEDKLFLAYQRLLTLCEQCKAVGVPIAIDAEYTSVQPAIDYLTYSAAIDYNKDSYPIIFGTIQAYLKDAKERMLLTTKSAENLGVSMGFKLVRGAYMSSETKLANSLRFDPPIHRSIKDTHDCFNACASFMLDKIDNGYGAVLLATHNVESARMAATKARGMSLGKGNSRLQFAQLYGMSDVLSFGLRNEGFIVSKYMPFGPVEMAMPYLLRRAEENKGMLSGSSLDKSLMREELKRRAKLVFQQGRFSEATKADARSAFN